MSYNNLRKLEDVIIDLEPLSAIVRAVCYASPEMHQMEVQSALYNITDQLDEVREKLRGVFDDLWQEHVTAKMDAFVPTPKPKPKPKTKGVKNVKP
jgi:hypothetical protein